MSQEAFAPVDAADVEIDISASSQRVLVREGQQAQMVAVRVMNNGTATVWIRAGDVAVVSTVARTPIGPGRDCILRFPIPATGRLYIAAIAAGATGKVFFTPGDGI
jgi:hypothetical protein